MRVIEVEQEAPSLTEVINWAATETIVLSKEGQLFALTPLDDFEAEVESLRNNPEFMEFLDQLSQEETVMSLEDLRKELGV